MEAINILSNDAYQRIDDMQMEVIHHMDDQTLLRYCRTSKWADLLCNSDAVWLPRINRVPGLSLLLPYRSHYKNLRDFYLNVRNDAQYVLMLFDKLQCGQWRILVVSHDINTIYEAFIRAMGNRLGMYDSPLEDIIRTINSATTVALGDIESVAIMVRFNDVIDCDTMEKYIINSNKQDLPNYFNPLILQYPKLIEKEIYATVEIKSDKLLEAYKHLAEPQNIPHIDDRVITDPAAIIPRYVNPPVRKIPSHAFVTNDVFINYDVASVRRAHSMKQNITIYLNESKYPDSDAYELTWMQHGYILRTDIDDYDQAAQGIMLVNFESIGMTPATYVFAITTSKICVRNSYLGINFFSQLTLTPEEYQQSIVKSLQDIVMKDDTKLYRFEDIGRVIRSMYED